MSPAWPIMKPIRKKSTTENMDKQHGTMTPKKVLSVLCVEGASPRAPFPFTSWSMRSSVSESDILGPTDLSEKKIRALLSLLVQTRRVRGNIYLRTFEN